MWVVVAVVGAASMTIRALPLVTQEFVRVSKRAQRGLRHAGIGAMTALLISAVLPADTGGSPADVALLLAVTLGAVLAWRRASIIVIVAAGSLGYLGLTVAL